LWFARIVKSRTYAATLVAEGKFRVNRIKVDKPSHWVKPGDVVTSTAQRTVRIFRVLAPGRRRGPAAEAALLYEDLTPQRPAVAPVEAAPMRAPGTGRPTKRDRRAIDRLHGRS
jgi:ribosome-associated heat shock protein Hsp15